MTGFVGTVLGAIGLAAGIAGGCASRGPVPTATAADVVVASSAFPAVTPEDLAQGRRLFVTKCSGCHSLPLPSRAPAGDWPTLVEAMRSDEEVVLTDQEASRVAAYLFAIASRPAPR